MSNRNESLNNNLGGSGGENKNTRVVSIGRVVSVEDPQASMRIKVRIKGIDDKYNDNQLPYSTPFLPMFLNIIPKVGEMVKVIFHDYDNPFQYREWMGPIISQPQKLKNDTYFIGATSSLGSGVFKSGKSIKNIVTAEGVYPTEEDIAFQGRENTDLIFRKSEVLIRAAKFVPNEPTIRNDKNPMSIHLRWLDPKTNTTINEDRTDINLMANKVFLIGRDSNSKIIPPNISLRDQIDLENKLHPLVYGDVLYDFMINFREWMFSHTHPYDNLPPNPADDPSVKMSRWFVEKLPLLCSKNVFAGGDTEPIKSQKK